MKTKPTEAQIKKQIERDLASRANIDHQIAELSDERGVINQRLMDGFNSLGEKSITVVDGDLRVTGTLVEPSSTIVDEGKLKKRLGAAMWNKITTRVLDGNKLGAFIKSGEISTTVLAACSDDVPKKPYIKVTSK